MAKREKFFGLGGGMAVWGFSVRFFFLCLLDWGYERLVARRRAMNMKIPGPTSPLSPHHIRHNKTDYLLLQPLPCLPA